MSTLLHTCLCERTAILKDYVLHPVVATVEHPCKHFTYPRETCVPRNLFTANDAF